MAVGMIRSVLSLCIITTLVATCLSYEQHNSIADEEESSNGANDLANADLEKRSFSARLPSIGLRNRGGLQEQEKKSGTLLRFGRRDANAESEYEQEDDDEMERRAERGSASASGATLLRFGKRAPLLRFGKRAPLLRFGKRAPLLRFGKRPDTLLRFGRSQERPHRRYERPDVTLRFG